MLPDRCLFWVAFLFAAFTSASMGTPAQAKSGCFLFQRYDSGNATVELRNSCSECREAVVRFCDGFMAPVIVPAGGVRRVNAFPNCAMRVAAERSCGETHPSRGASSARSRPVAFASKNEPLPRRQDSKTSPPRHTLTGPPPKSAGPAGLNTIAPHQKTGSPAPPQEKEEPFKNGSTLTLQQMGPNAAIKPSNRSAVQRAVFPGTSEEDWSTLICSLSGQTLVHEAEALLTRKEILQVMLVEIWFSADADRKQNEWAAALKEIQAIERELSQFDERARAIIARPAKE